MGRANTGNGRVRAGRLGCASAALALSWPGAARAALYSFSGQTLQWSSNNNAARVVVSSDLNGSFSVADGAVATGYYGFSGSSGGVSGLGGSVSFSVSNAPRSDTYNASTNPTGGNNNNYLNTRSNPSSFDRLYYEASTGYLKLYNATTADSLFLILNAPLNSQTRAYSLNNATSTDGWCSDDVPQAGISCSNKLNITISNQGIATAPSPTPLLGLLPLLHVAASRRRRRWQARVSPSATAAV